MVPTHYTFLVLIVTIALFAWDKLRADYVALASMFALFLGGILTPSQALQGFGDTMVIMIAALFRCWGRIVPYRRYHLDQP